LYAFIFAFASVTTAASALAADDAPAKASVKADDAPLKAGDAVAVAEDGVGVKTDTRVLGTLSKGKVVTLELVDGELALIRTTENGQAIRGWIKVNQLARTPGAIRGVHATGDVSAAIAVLKKHGATFVEDKEGRVVEMTLVFGKSLPPADLARIKLLADLRRVTIASVELGDDSLSPLSALTNLESLRLMGRKITDDGLRHIAHATELRELALYRTQISGAGLKQLAVFKKLEKLDLSVTPGPFGMSKVQDLLNSTMSADDREFLTEDLFNRALRLRLHEKTIFNSVLASEGLADDAIKELSVCTSLKVLELSGLKIGDAGLKDLGPLANLEQLYLIVTDKPVTDEGLKSIGKLKNLRFVVLPLAKSDMYTTEGADNLQRRFLNARSFPNSAW